MRADRVLVIDGDLVLDDAILSSLLKTPSPAIAIDSRKVMGYLDDKARVESGRVVAVGKRLARPTGASVGIMLLDRAAIRALAASRSRDFYEPVLDPLLRRRRWNAVDLAGRAWQEVDFLGDYLAALRDFGGRGGTALAKRLRRDLTRRTLFCPGPVMVSERVKRAAMNIEIGHREDEFMNILCEVRKKLVRLGGSAEHLAITIPGSGSAANETVLGSLPRRSRILSLANGEFGERLAALAERHGHRVDRLDFGWGGAIEWKRVAARLSAGRHRYLTLVHHETSTGTLNDLQAAARVARRTGARVMVDCVSSIGGVATPLAGIEFATGSTNKCLAALPGLAFVLARPRARRELAPAVSQYLDLGSHWDIQEERGQTLNTPAVSLYLALNAALDEILEAGPRHFQEIAALNRLLRCELGALGLETAPGSDSPLLVNFLLPPGATFPSIHAHLKEDGFIVYPGKGPLAGRIFQVANLGRITRRDVAEFVRAVKSFIAANQ
jgi:2-aminoethylphosphonate-pyruvate transaminase